MTTIKVVKSAKGFPQVLDADDNRLSEVAIKEIHFYPEDQEVAFTYFTDEGTEIDIAFHRAAFALSLDVPYPIYASMTGQDFEETEEEDE